MRIELPAILGIHPALYAVPAILALAYLSKALRVKKMARLGRELAGVAEQLGARFTPSAVLDLDRVPDLRGHSEYFGRKVYNLLEGQIDGFEYLHFTGRILNQRTGKAHPDSQATQDLTLVRVPGADLRPCELTAEDGLTRTVARLGAKDWHPEGYPEFDRLYFLLEGEPEDAERSFTPPVLDYLSTHPGWIIKTSGEWVALQRKATIAAKKVPPEELPAHLQEAVELASLFAP